ncbi:hypothetical protein OAU87_03050 [Alphaproteobacteria bacterium]|nr:hypothetical protein [Alphaproteobacteria bacterium]
MITAREKIIIICIFLAKFDNQAYSFIEDGESKRYVHSKIGSNFSINKNTIKNIRDEFDSYFPKTSRVGWKKKLDKEKQKFFEQYKEVEFEEFSTLIKTFLQKSDTIKTDKISNVNQNLSKIKLREFTEEGLQAYELFFLDAQNNIEDYKSGKGSFNQALLVNDKYTRIIDENIVIDFTKNFISAYDLGKYLYLKLKDYNQDNLLENFKLFNWITYGYFKQLYPGDRGGKDRPRYIWQDEKSVFYRHQTRMPWEMFYSFGENSKVLLTNKINNASDMLEQILSNSGNDLLNENFIKLINDLYLIEHKSSISIKKKVRDKNGYGTLRRLKSVTKKLMVNYQLKDLKYKQYQRKIFNVTDEFDKWLT